MADFTKNPGDRIDLLLLLQSFGESIGTLFPQAHVYDSADNEITGSPFTLTEVANNYYSNLGAFQISENSATYKIVYLVYTDSGFTTRSSAHGEKIDTITVALQSTTGLGGFGSMKNQGGDVIVDMDPFIALVKDIEKRLEKKMNKLQKDFDGGLKLEATETDFSVILDKFSDLKMSILDNKKSPVEVMNAINNVLNIVKKGNEKIVKDIKKNRSTTIKHKFDKAMLKPMLQSVANSDLKTTKKLDEVKIDVSKMMDAKNAEANEMFNESMDNMVGKVEVGINKLNESVRKKLKTTLEGLRTLLFVGKQSKQNINITLKKDDE